MILDRSADHRPQKLGTGSDKLRRQQSRTDEPIGAVNVGDDALKEIGALDQTRCDRAPLAFLDHQRHMRQRPLARVRPTLVVGAVVDAGIAQIVIGAGELDVDFAAGHSAQPRNQRLPCRPDPAIRPDHLVDRAWPRTIIREQAGAASFGNRRRVFHGARFRPRA